MKRTTPFASGRVVGAPTPCPYFCRPDSPLSVSVDSSSRCLARTRTGAEKLLHPREVQQVYVAIAIAVERSALSASGELRTAQASDSNWRVLRIHIAVFVT